MKQPETAATEEPVTSAPDSLTKGFWSRLLDCFQPAPRAPTLPRLGRVVMHPITCVGCSKPLEHGQLVVTVDGALSDGTPFPFTGHALCMVVVRKPDGSIESACQPHKHNVLLNESEWERWRAAEARGETLDGELRVFGMKEHALGRLVSRR